MIPELSAPPIPFTDVEIDRFVEQLELEEQRRIGYELNAADAPDERS